MAGTYYIYHKNEMELKVLSVIMWLNNQGVGTRKK